MLKIIGQVIENTVDGVAGINLTLATPIIWDFKDTFKVFFDSLEDPELLKDQQNLLEMDTFLHWIQSIVPKDRPFTYVEVGSYAGESLFFIAQVLPKGSHMVLVDYGDHPVARKLLFLVIDWIKTNLGHTINLLSKDSTDRATVKLVLEIMKDHNGGSRADLCFIDANHMFSYAFADLQNFLPISDFVALHDISDKAKESSYANFGVDQAMVRHLWQVVGYCWPERTEYILDTKSAGKIKPRGFGLISNKWKPMT